MFAFCLKYLANLVNLIGYTKKKSNRIKNNECHKNFEDKYYSH